MSVNSTQWKPVGSDKRRDAALMERIFGTQRSKNNLMVFLARGKNKVRTLTWR